MKINKGSILRLTSAITVWSTMMFIYCGVFSNPAVQSKIARFNVTKWLEKKFPRPVKFVGTNYVCLTTGGRLGNHLFQYASIYGIAKQHNFTIILKEDDELIQYFNVTSERISHDNFICDTFEKVLELNACCTFDYNLMNLAANRNYVIGDWLQSWKYFRDYFAEIREEFTFRKEIRESAEYIVNNLRYTSTGNATMVGIHVRLGDMINTEFLQNDGYRPAPPSYIHSAINFMLSRFQNVVFIVCSDDINYAKNLIGTRERDIILTVFYFSISPIQDLAILSKCDHLIMTVGTFGWWAGFLTNGTVLYYKHPYTEYTPKWWATNFEDFYPPNWIALE